MIKLSKKNVIIRPLVSEKSAKLYNEMKVVTFVVDRRASKKEVSFNFEQLFNIKPIKVNFVMTRSIKNTRDSKTYRLISSRKLMKKAYICIGDNKLEIFENLIK